MKVSFVVPFYKKKPGQLQATLQSLKVQSHKDIEVVVIFDGPDPDAEKIMDNFKSDARFSYKVIVHGGAPRARNEGFKLTTGDVVSFWDTDAYAEPHMTREWVRTFKDNSDCDFVYSGYKFTDPNYPGFESEPFDPWVLQKYNYLSSMFPLKRDKFPGWDEDLTGLQDWDYWRRVVDKGSKGRFIPGYGFATDLPDKESISGNFDKTKERIRKIRAKHEDVKKDILVYGSLYQRESVQLAKLLDADYFWNSFWQIEEYKMVVMVGFHYFDLKNAGSFFHKLSPETTKVVYWMGLDAEAYYCAPYHEVKKLMPQIKQSINHNFCDSKRTEDILMDLDIPVQILPFPREEGLPCEALPKEVKVLALADEEHKALLESLARAMPQVQFDLVAHHKHYNLTDYTGAIQLTTFPRLVQASRNVLMNGRYLLSNVQEPFAGYIDTSDVTKFKNEAVKEILSWKAKNELNVEAQRYYLDMTMPENFKDKIMSLLRKPLEVVK